MTQHPLRHLPLLALAVLGCASPLSLPEDTHVFGQYQTCLQRVSDTCAEADAGCRSLPSSTQAVMLGVRRGTDEFLIAREHTAPVAGILEGNRFRVESVVELADVCGCPAEVVEIIEGELLSVPMGEIACHPLARDGGTCLLAPPDSGDEPDAGHHDEEEPDAGDPDAGQLDLSKRYPAIRGKVTNEVRATGDGACPCLPCRAEFELVGRP